MRLHLPLPKFGEPFFFPSHCLSVSFLHFSPLWTSLSNSIETLVGFSVGSITINNPKPLQYWVGQSDSSVEKEKKNHFVPSICFWRPHNVAKKWRPSKLPVLFIHRVQITINQPDGLCTSVQELYDYHGGQGQWESKWAFNISNQLPSVYMRRRCFVLVWSIKEQL